VKLPISARWHDGSHFHVKVVDGQIAIEVAQANLVSAEESRAYGDVA
jgi:hypothetical protein